MRRPNTISGMLAHLARFYIARSPRIAALATVTVTGLGMLAVHQRAEVPEVPVYRTAISHPVVAPLGGNCSQSETFCVSDSMCSRGDHCVDTTHALATLRNAAVQHGIRDDDALPISPSLTYNGEGWSLVWSALTDESADLWFARANAAGQRIGQPVRLTRSPTLKILPSLASSPDGYAVAYTEVGDEGVSAWMQRLDRTGAVKGSPIRLGAASSLDIAPRTVWNGHDFATIWYHADSPSDLSVRFVRIAPDGSRVGNERAIAEKIIPTGIADLRAMTDGYGAAWSSIAPRGDNGQTVFVRVGQNGEASAPMRVAAAQGQNGSVSLAWSSQSFGVLWEDNMSIDDQDEPLSRLAFAGVTPTSVSIPRRELTPRDAFHTQASLVWGTSQYGVAYARLASDGADVFFNRLSAQGEPSRAPLKFTAGALGLFPTLAHSGSEFGISWLHLGARGIELRFARVNAEGKRVGNDTVMAGE
jgi:hypothetical protein